jgi:hypothetical protein
VALSLHRNLQLHRIAVQKTYETRFHGTTEKVPIPETDGLDPIYGVIEGSGLRELSEMRAGSHQGVETEEHDEGTSIQQGNDDRKRLMERVA